MKAKDLMIGDWVQGYTPDTYSWIYGIFNEERIAIIASGTATYIELSIEDIQPIPLTPEILEKNGFKFDGSGQRSMMLMTPWEEQGIRYNIYVGLKKKTIEVFAAHPEIRVYNWRKINKVYLEVCGCCVHELQHALRLCGIDKEIVL